MLEEWGLRLSPAQLSLPGVGPELRNIIEIHSSPIA